MIVIVAVCVYNLPRAVAVAGNIVAGQLTPGRRIYRVSEFLAANGSRGDFKAVLHTGAPDHILKNKLRHRTAANVAMTYKQNLLHNATSLSWGYYSIAFVQFQLAAQVGFRADVVIRPGFSIGEKSRIRKLMKKDKTFPFLILYGIIKKKGREKMYYIRPSKVHYRIAQAASWLVSTVIFRRKTVRNEIKNKDGAFVVIANHGAALDFVNLIGATARPMSFVISKSFHDTLPFKGFMQKIGVIPKQQFQTTVKDMKRIKAVIDAGEPVVIYPAGLMSEDGLSTPIPSATYKFLRWLDADVYVARSTGSYFVMPKWAKGFRPGRTEMDIYKLFSRQELQQLSLEQIQQKTDGALLFDAYREQERMLVPYRNNADIRGLENVLYMCPHCMTEFSVHVRGSSTLQCTVCGYTAQSDRYAFLHNGDSGGALRYVSDWSRRICENLKERIERDPAMTLSSPAKILMIRGNKFQPVGEGVVTLSAEHFCIEGTLQGEAAKIVVPIGNIPTLPFKPGRHFEIQDGSNIYRCAPEDGRLVMKYINMLKIFYQKKNARI